MAWELSRPCDQLTTYFEFSHFTQEMQQVVSHDLPELSWVVCSPVSTVYVNGRIFYTPSTESNIGFIFKKLLGFLIEAGF